MTPPRRPPHRPSPRRAPLGAASLRALVASGLALALACGGDAPAPAPSTPGLTITSLEVLSESIAPAYWSSPPANNQTAFYDFWIHYSGDLAFADLAWARVYTPDGASWWTLSRDPQLFDPARRVIGGYGRWFGPEINLLPIGFLIAEIKLTSGAVAWGVAYVPDPGGLTATRPSMNSEDRTPPAGTSVPMVRRASPGTSGTATAATGTISLGFTVIDPNVHDGAAWFYDSAGSYLGGSAGFRDPVTGLVTAALGGALEVEGAENVLTLRAGDIAFLPGKGFDQVARFVVVLTDGAQYGLQPSSQARVVSRSISASAPLTRQ